MATAFADASGRKRTWAVSAEQERADYIEVCHDYTQKGSSRDFKTLKGHLKHIPNTSPILDWLRAPREFSEQYGGLRMLICDRHRYSLELPILEDTYDDLVRLFKLSSKTLQSFDCDAGTFFRTYTRDESDQVTGINIVMKAPQKREVGNYGLSMHYDFNTGVTTALLFGTDVIVCQDEPDALPQGKTDRRQVELPNHPNLALPHDLRDADGDTGDVKKSKKTERDKWYFDNIHHRDDQTPQKDHYQRARPTLLRSLESRKLKLKHPLTLPCLFLDDHITRIHEECEHGTVPRKTWEIMNELGMRSDDRGEEHIFWIEALGIRKAYTEQGVKDRVKAEELTAKLDRHVLRIMFSQRIPEWNQQCSEFLLDLASEINKKAPVRSSVTAEAAAQPHVQGPAGTLHSTQAPHDRSSRHLDRFKGGLHESLKESLEFNIQMSKSLLSRLTSARENMQLQLDVCGSITGQASNEFSARIAWDTSRDSTSMKILAVITAIFLPGTFVATFMSMGIWNWQWSDSAPDNSNPGVVSPLWYVWLVATVVLMGATGVLWVGWWLHELTERELNYLDTSITRPDLKWYERLAEARAIRQKKARDKRKQERKERKEQVRDVKGQPNGNLGA